MLLKFRNIRKEKGLSLSDIANELHVSTSYISLIERGQRNLDYKFAIKLANIFYMTPDELFLEDIKGEE